MRRGRRRDGRAQTQGGGVVTAAAKPAVAAQPAAAAQPEPAATVVVPAVVLERLCLIYVADVAHGRRQREAGDQVVFDWLQTRKALPLTAPSGGRLVR